MEPTFFQTAGSSQSLARRRARRRNQLLAGVVVLGIFGVGLFMVLRFGGSGTGTPSGPAADTPLAGASDAPSSDLARAAADAPAPAPIPRRPIVNPTPAADSALATPPATPAPVVPPAPPAPVARDKPVTPAQLKDLRAKLAEGQSLVAGKDWLAARNALCPILDQGLPATENDQCMKLITEVADQTIMNSIHVAGDPATALFDVPPGGVYEKIGKRYKVVSTLLEKVNNLPANRLQANQKIKVVNGPFHAAVDKSAFTLTVYLDVQVAEGKTMRVPVRRFAIGLGRDNGTPTGAWKVKNKEVDQPWHNPRSREVIMPGDPKYPLGKPGRWMGLIGLEGNAKDQHGYGIHGTNEPDSIGKQESMGCVRMRDADVAQVWDFLRIEDSRVFVKD